MPSLAQNQRNEIQNKRFRRRREENGSEDQRSKNQKIKNNNNENLDKRIEKGNLESEIFLVGTRK